MAVQYINSPEKDFEAGIDARSAENQIRPGFVKDLLNADIVEQRARKRKGYQGFAGNVPIRATKLEYDLTNQQVCFTLDTAVSLDSSISLESVRSSPLVVYGRSRTFTSGQGPFTNAGDTAKYYPGFTVPVRKKLFAGTGTLTIPGTEHGLATTNLFISVVESTSLSDRSYQRILTNSVAIDETSFDVTIGYTVAADTTVFVYFADKSTVVGSSYVATLAHPGGGSQTFSIPAATHQLTNFNIVPQIQQDLGTTRGQVIPDQFLIASNGDVSVTLNSSSSATFYVMLADSVVTNTVTGVVAASSSGTVTISAPTKPWAFHGIYLEQTPGGTKELVYPDTIDYDESLNEITLSFVNQAAVARNFIVFYQYGSLRANTLCVSDTVSVDGTDFLPQITLWGLDHSEIYSTKVAREAWVNHIDSYRRSGEQRLISGLGGNLFSVRENSEAASTYLYPTLFPNVIARTDTDKVLGPLLWDTGETPARTRGYITADASGTHWAAVSAVQYDTGTGWTKYTLELPSKQILDSTGSPTTLSSVISTTTNLEDWLTVSGMSYSRHEGTFRIRQVADGGNQVFIWVENSGNSSDYDDSGTAGEAGVFTDQLSWSGTAPFIAGDSLASEVLGDTTVSSVLSSVDTVSVCDGMTDKMEVPGGLLFSGGRTSSVVPLRLSVPTRTSSSTNLVRGDMLSYTGLDRLLRVQYVNSDSDRDITISGSSVTLGSGDTSFLREGMSVLFLNAGEYSGTQTVSAITSLTEFQIDTTLTSTATGTLVGNTMQIDENLSWADSTADTNVFICEERWIPLEAPDDSFDQTPATHVRYWDTSSYTNQPFLRSTMVTNNLYLTNYQDEVYKLDGSHIYRAGIIPWQPGLMLTQETSGATIVTNLRSISYSAIVAGEGKLTITADTSNILPAGTSVRLSGSDQTYKVASYNNDGTTFFVLMDRALDSGVSSTGSVKEIGVFRYYFRLNAVDANSNIVASAVTSYQDYVVELTGNAAVQLKLVGLPAWDVYDYERLEVQIYRTKMNTAAPFYLVTTLAMNFNNTTGYITYRDTFADTDLTQLDVVNTALKGTELGTGWTDPLRAKYVTTVDNRLVLGNVKDYPQLDVQVVGDATLGASSFAGGTLLFRRDENDTGSTTNMVDRAKYEWKNGFSGDASNFVIGTNQFSFDVSGTAPSSPGDWVYLTYSTVAQTGRQLDYAGWWQVASVSGSTVTVNLSGAASATSYPNKYVLATSSVDIPVLLGVDGSMGMVNGHSFDIFDTMRRMSLAINSTMRMVDTSLNSMANFIPWMVCRSGNDTPPAGRLLVRQARADSTTVSVEPTFSGYDLFINSVKRSSGNAVSASTRLYPSRIIVSYQNYAEIFDNPTSVLDTDSDSAVDINSADGQEITGIIPFFGQAAFTAAQQAAILVVFKTNSIYLVDLNEKAQGNQAVQRIETEGLGCTAPYSIAVTKNGIIFANESGMYCLRRDQSIQYLGRFMERNWTERVDLQALQIAQGHHYGVGRAYKLSVPIADTIDTSTGYVENSEVFLYNHTGEDNGGVGAWGRYDNHPATGWANLGSDAFFGSTNGRVLVLRRTGSLSDFRDDSDPIQFQLDLRPNDFGNSGIRKIVDKAIVHYRTGVRNTGTTVLYAVDLTEEFTETTPLVIAHGTSGTGVDDQVAQAIATIAHSVGRRRCIFFTLRITNNGMDEDIEIAGVDFKVGGLNQKGILQAGSTT